MIKSYWLRIILCGIAAAILGFLIGVVTPKQYDAVCQVMVAPVGGSLGGPQTDADQVVQDILQATAPRSVSTQVEQLTSYGVIKDAAEKVATDMNLPFNHPGDELNPFDLQDRITVTAAKESDIVTLRVRMSDPELAQRVAQAMYVAFEDQNDRQAKFNANRAIDFLSAQDKQIQDKLHAIATSETRAKESVGAADIAIQTSADIAQVRELDTQLKNAVADQAAALTRAEELKKAMVGVPKTIPGVTGTSENPEYAAIQAQVTQIEAEREQALQKYMEDNEIIQGLDRRLKIMRAKLKPLKRFIVTSTSSQPNPLLQGLEADYKSSLTIAAAAEKRATALGGMVAEKKADVAKLPAIQQKLDDYARQRAVLERMSQTYQSKLTSLKFAGSSRRSATGLITAAVAIPRPAVPNIGLNVGLGLFLGLGIGFLWSIGTEAKRNPIRSLGQLNRLSLQPCYRVISELRVPMRGLSRPPAEVFDSLLVNFVRSEKKGYRLGVLGVTKNAGATTTAMNLAIAAARGGYSVLYVEVDPGNNALTRLTPAAGDVKSPGANISIYNASLGETLSGGTMGLPSDLELAAESKDLVIFDFSPVKVSGDSFLLASQLDEMILLVRANVTKSVDFLQAQQALIDAGCPLVTVALSRVQDQSDDVAALEQQADVRSITPQA